MVPQRHIKTFFFIEKEKKINEFHWMHSIDFARTVSTSHDCKKWNKTNNASDTVISFVCVRPQNQSN